MKPEERERQREHYERERQAWERDQRRERAAWEQARELERVLAKAKAEARTAQKKVNQALAALAAAKSAADTSMSQRRKPGKRPTADWPLVVAVELIRTIRADQPEPTAAEMSRRCERDCDYHPDIREMQRLLKRLRG